MLNLSVDLEIPRTDLIGQDAEIVDNGNADAADAGATNADPAVADPADPAAPTNTPANSDATFAIPMAVVEDADRQSGFVAVEATGEQHVTLNFNNGPVLPIVDVADLPLSGYRPEARLVAAHRYAIPNYSITLSEQRFNRQAVPTAVIRKVDIQSTLAETGQLQHQAEIDFVAVGIQSLELSLPENAELWSTVINGKPVEVRRADQAWLIPLPRMSPPDCPRVLKISWATKINPLGMTGRIEQQPPRLSVINGNSREPLETLEQSWTLHYPDGQMLVDSDGKFQPTDNGQQAGVIRSLQRFLHLPGTGRAKSATLATGLAAAVIFVFVSIWGRTSDRGLLAGLFTFAIVCGLLWFLTALTTPAVQQARSVADNAQIAWEMDGETDPSGAFLSDRDEEVTPEIVALPPQKPGSFESDDKPSQAPQTEAPEPPAATPAFGSRQLTFEGKTGARLSVDVDFQRAANQATSTFHYSGSADATQTGALNVRYQNRQTGVVLRIAIVIFVALLFWFFRNANFRGKTVLAVLCLLIPIGAVPLVPAEFQFVPDGIFLGACAGIFLWCIRWFFNRLETAWHTGITKTATSILVGFCIGSFAQTAYGQPDNMRTPAAQSHMGSLKDDTIVVPFDPEGIPLMAPNVFISHEQFLQLWNAAHPDEQKHQPPGVAASVSTAAWNAKLIQQDDTTGRIEVRGRIVLNHFSETPATIELPFGLVALSKATLSSDVSKNVPAAIRVRERTVTRTRTSRNPKQSAAPSQKTQQRQQAAQPKIAAADRVYELTLTDGGTHILDVEFALPAKLSGPAGRFTIPLKAVPGSLLTFELPSPDLVVRVNESSSAFRKTTADDDSSLIEIPANHGGNISVNWQPAEQRGANDSIVHASTASLATVNDAGMNVKTVVNYQVRQGSVSELEFTLSKGLRLQRITGTDVGGWERGNEQSRQLKIFLRRAVTDSTRVQIELYQPLTIAEKATIIPIPQLAPTQVTRETGTLGVSVEPHFVVRAATRSNVTQINPDQFSKAATGLDVPAVPALAWKYAARPFAVSVRLSRRAEESVVTAHHAARVELRRIRWTSLYDLNLRGAARSRVALRLPAGLVPTDVDASSLADWYLHEDNGRVLVVEFGEPRLGRTQVTLAGFVPRAVGDQTVSIQCPEYLNADRLESQLAVWFDDLFAANIVDLGKWKSTDPGSLPDELRKLQPRPARFGFSSRVIKTDPISFRLNRVQPGLVARSVTTATASDFSNDYAVNLKWKITTAAADTLIFSGPDWLAKRLTFHVDGLRQMEETEPANGRVQWTLTLQEPVSGEFFAMAIASVPPADTLRIPVIEFHEQAAGTVSSLTTQSHFAVLMNNSTGTLTATNPDLVRPAERTELPIRIPDELIIQATEIVRVDRPLTWSIRRVVAQTGAPASVNLADVATTIAADGSWRVEAIYTIRNRSRQFLPLMIPEGSRLLSVFVKEKPARPVISNRNGAELRLIALPRTSEADLSFQVRIVLAGQLDATAIPSARFSRKNLTLPAPAILSLQQDPEFGIPVIRTRWKVWVPNEWDASPLDDPTATNVTLQDAESEDSLYLLAKAQEAQELLAIFSSRSSSNRQRAQAKRNLEQLDESFRGYEKQNDELAGKLNELQERISEVAEQQATKNFYIDINGNGLIDVDAIQMGNTFNNKAIFDLNPNREQQQQLSSGSFNFSVGVKGRQTVGGFEAGSGKIVDSKTWSAKPSRRYSKQGLLQKRNKSDNSLSQLNSQLQSRGQGAVPNSAVTDSFGGPGGQAANQAGSGGFSGFGGFGGGRASGRQGQPTLGAGAGGMGMGGGGVGADMGGEKMGAGGMGGGGGRNFNDQSGPAGGLGVSQFGPGDGALQMIPAQQAGQGDDLLPADGHVTPWKQAGGLSLQMHVPRNGREMTFTRINGAPMLTLVVRPRRTRELGMGILWAIACAVICMTCITLLVKRGKTVATDLLLVLIALLSLAGVYFLTEPFAQICFVVFATSALCGGIRYAIRSRKQNRPVAPAV